MGGVAATGKVREKRKEVMTSREKRPHRHSDWVRTSTVSTVQYNSMLSWFCLDVSRVVLHRLKTLFSGISNNDHQHINPVTA